MNPVKTPPSYARRIDEVLVSNDGLRGVLLSHLEKTRIAGQGRVEALAVIVSTPDAVSKATVTLVLSENYYASYESYCRMWGLGIDESLPVFASIVLGESIEGGHPERLVVEEGLIDVAGRRPADFDEILDYLCGKVFWNWRFRRPETKVMTSDLIRLSSTKADLTEVIALREGELWSVTSDLTLKPTGRLLDGFQNKITASAPTRYSRPRFVAVVSFSDLVGSTQLAHEEETLAIRTIESFEGIARKSIGEKNGEIVKFMGDGVLALFANVPSAVRASCQMIEHLDLLSKDLGREIRMRSGIHLGEVVRGENGDIHGDTVNVAARIQAEAAPGRVVISEDAWRQLRRQPEIHCSDLGQHRLKGLEETVHLFEVEAV